MVFGSELVIHAWLVFVETPRRLGLVIRGNCEMPVFFPHSMGNGLSLRDGCCLCTGTSLWGCHTSTQNRTCG